ncbi:MAG TPA: biotin carboxylase N-terminal domain-containing protein [Planctomycetaceae bacterium]|nr:biotin carboxylase N-terminal domain-containing protein [Planctomycetaceae bacterium]
MFKKILIANRGEIACRIARTCHRLGIAVAGVHSAADAEALHVRMIGESFEIGNAAASESYLRSEAVIDAAKASGAQAIHPGFGFLAENAGFARAVEAAGLVFIGPTPETIERLGDKASAKCEAEAAGLPTVPGSKKPSEDAREIAGIVRELGLPVMLKAAAGGGGRGMRAVTHLDGLAGEIDSAMREAKNSFGYSGLIVEKLVERGRHIEVQIVGDGEGSVIHLFERECSLQRRHQKLIEEAPAANLSTTLRERMLADSVRLGERLNYRGVGTVEFILSENIYYFLEVNPRLQVEHPVTEMVTGIDIVETMLRIAAGEGLPFAQSEVRCDGHAVEARICAEDPANNFLPCSGDLAYVKFPADGVRIETGVESGSAVTPYYDSMLAKLIAHAETRDAALDKLDRALGETSIFGITTNQAFLKRLIGLPATRAASFHTRLIDEQIDQLVDRAKGADIEALALGAYFWMVRQRQPAGHSPWQSREMIGWQMADSGDGLSPIPILHLEAAGVSAEIRFAPRQPDGAMMVGIDDDKRLVRLIPLGNDSFTAIIGARRETVRIYQHDQTVFVHDLRGVHALTAIPYLTYISATSETSGELRAPMMGMILKVNVAIGDRVKAGDVAAILESMKMELRISSETDGVVTAVNCRAGETVERNAIVVVVEPDRQL